MADSGSGQEPQGGNGQEPPLQAPAPTGSDGAPKQFDEAYVKQLREEAAANRIKAQQAEAALAKIEADKAEQERKALEEQGKFKELYDSLNATHASTQAELERLKELESKVAQEQEALRRAAIDELPEDLRETFKDAPLEIVKATAAKLKATGTSPNAPNQRQSHNPPSGQQRQIGSPSSFKEAWGNAPAI